MNRERMEAGLALFIEGLLEGTPGIAADLRSEMTASTPRRVVQALADDLLGGYQEDPLAVLEPIPAPPGAGPVLLGGILFASVCAHHLLPFRGRAYVGFLPGRSYVGLGGIARLVDALSRRLAIQETLTQAIAGHLERALQPRAVLVMLEAEHQCLSVRGTRKTGHRFRTVERRGERCPDLEALLTTGDAERW